jgi:hypothetical protein
MTNQGYEINDQVAADRIKVQYPESLCACPDCKKPLQAIPISSRRNALICNNDRCQKFRTSTGIYVEANNGKRK